MSDPSKPQQPSPDLFFETMNAYQRTAALKAAIELELFSAIGAGANTADALAQRLGVAQRGARILCDYLVVIGFLTKRGAQYELTPDSALFLDQRSPAYLGGAMKFLGSPMLTRGFDDVAELVRRGGRTGPDSTVEPENPVWVEFAKAMAPMMKRPAELVADLAAADSRRVKKVLDIAAGHGLFGIAVARRFAGAEIVALDWPNVLAVAEGERAAGRNLRPFSQPPRQRVRCRLRPGLRPGPPHELPAPLRRGVVRDLAEEGARSAGQGRARHRPGVHPRREPRLAPHARDVQPDDAGDDTGR